MINSHFVHANVRHRRVPVTDVRRQARFTRIRVVRDTWSRDCRARRRGASHRARIRRDCPELGRDGFTAGRSHRSTLAREPFSPRDLRPRPSGDIV